MIVYTKNSSKRKKPSKVQIKSAEEFSMKIKSIPLPSGSKIMPTMRNYGNKLPRLGPPPGRESPKIPSKPDTVLGACTKTGIMRDYHKLSKNDRDTVEEIASCTAPLHKGNYVYVTPGMNPAGFGRKNEVL
jgi:hypothetical protein